MHELYLSSLPSSLPLLLLHSPGPAPLCPSSGHRRHTPSSQSIPPTYRNRRQPLAAPPIPQRLPHTLTSRCSVLSIQPCLTPLPSTARRRRPPAISPRPRNCLNTRAAAFSIPSPASGLSLFVAPVLAPAVGAVTAGHPIVGVSPSGSHMAQPPCPLLM